MTQTATRVPDITQILDYLQHAASLNYTWNDIVGNIPDYFNEGTTDLLKTLATRFGLASLVVLTSVNYDVVIDTLYSSGYNTFDLDKCVDFLLSYLNGLNHYCKFLTKGDMDIWVLRNAIHTARSLTYHALQHATWLHTHPEILNDINSSWEQSEIVQYVESNRHLFPNMTVLEAVASIESFRRNIPERLSHIISLSRLLERRFIMLSQNEPITQEAREIMSSFIWDTLKLGRLEADINILNFFRDFVKLIELSKRGY